MNKNFRTGFTLIEVLLIFTVMSVLLAASIPLISGKSVPVPLRMQQGAYYCIADDTSGKLIEAYYTKRRLVSEDYVEKCRFNPPARASAFRIELIGAGAGGNGFVNVTNPRESYTINYRMVGGYGDYNNYRSKLFYELKPAEIWNLFKNITLKKSALAQQGSAGGIINPKPLTSDRCNCENKKVTKFSCRVEHQSDVNGAGTFTKVCRKTALATSDANWENAPLLDGVNPKDLLTNYQISEICRTKFGGSYECAVNSTSDYAFGGYGGKGGYIVGSVTLPNVSYSTIKSSGYELSDLLASYANRMKSGRCKKGTDYKNCTFVESELENFVDSRTNRISDAYDVGTYKQQYAPNLYKELCNMNLSEIADGGKLCYAKPGKSSQEYAAVQVPANDNGVAYLQTDGYDTIIQQGLAKGGGPGGFWSSGDERTLIRYNRITDPIMVLGYNLMPNEYISFDGSMFYYHNKAPYTNRAKEGASAYLELDGDGKPIELPQERVTNIPYADIVVDLTYRLYKLGNPGPAGERKVYTVSSLKGPCKDITVKFGDGPHNNVGESATTIPTADELGTKMVCAEQTFYARGGQFDDQFTPDENRYDYTTYKNEKTFSFEPAKDNRKGGFIEDLNTVFYKHIKEYINGIDGPQDDSNRLSQIGAGGDGAKFVDKCQKRFKGILEAKIHEGDDSTDTRANPYVLNKDGELMGECIDDTENDSNGFYGTKNNLYEYTKATAGRGGAVIITW